MDEDRRAREAKGLPPCDCWDFGTCCPDCYGHPAPLPAWALKRREEAAARDRAWTQRRLAEHMHESCDFSFSPPQTPPPQTLVATGDDELLSRKEAARLRARDNELFGWWAVAVACMMVSFAVASFVGAFP